MSCKPDSHISREEIYSGFYKPPIAPVTQRYGNRYWATPPPPPRVSLSKANFPAHTGRKPPTTQPRTRTTTHANLLGTAYMTPRRRPSCQPDIYSYALPKSGQSGHKSTTRRICPSSGWDARRVALHSWKMTMRKKTSAGVSLTMILALRRHR